MDCTIVDFGMGNIRSLEHKLRAVGIGTTVATRPGELAGASALLLPGVGHFGTGMAALQERDLVGALEEQVCARRTPILGICLGMQLMTSWSEEGDVAGLGWFSARTRRFDFAATEQASLPVPHVGWNTLEARSREALFAEVPAEKRFYFIHSYYVDCDGSTDAVALTDYGGRFASVIGREHMVGMQFHPEKSHRSGLQVVVNFLRLAASREAEG